MALGLNPPVIQITGFQNSGKTTLLQGFIERMSNIGYRVGTLKHHGHDNSLIAVDQEKDTGKHRKSGAVASGIEGNGMFQLNVTKEHWSVTELIEIYSRLHLDVILMEGFKHENYPKVVLLRYPEDEFLLKEITKIIMVVKWYEAPLNDQLQDNGFITFHIEQKDEIFTWLVKYLKDVIG